jgi:hypothetical protein
MGLEEVRKLKELAAQPKQLKRYAIPKKSAKKIEQEKQQAQQNKITGGSELQRWFNDRRKEMLGVCSNCGGKTEKNNDQYFAFSIAHIFPKAYFPSIKTHPKNFIELCHFGNSCHTNFDNGNININDLNCFNEVIEKFIEMYPIISEKEKRRIPKILVEYYEANK